MTETIYGKDGLVVRDSGEWIQSKFHYLSRYLKTFTVSMKGKWDLYYVDLFAGPGRCKIRESHEELDGSPLIALLANNFDKYYFFEADPECYEALTQRVKK
jgi:three-Cys-motif partner protein